MRRTFIRFGIIVVIGFALVIRGGLLLMKSRESNSWPSTDGVVKTAKLAEGTRGLLDNEKCFCADIRYDYVVGGKTYTGDRIRVGGKKYDLPIGPEDDLKKSPPAKRSRSSIHPPTPPTAFWKPQAIRGTGSCSFSALHLSSCLCSSSRRRRCDRGNVATEFPINE